MIKLYVYDEAPSHVHDKNPNYFNTVPLSVHVLPHFVDSGQIEITHNPDEADYFYMGQWSDDTPIKERNPLNYAYFKDRGDCHIVDIEGDWPHTFPSLILHKSILTINSARTYMKDWFENIYVRPTFSTLLVNAAKNRHSKFVLPSTPIFGFRGLPDQHGIRVKLKTAIHKAYTLKASRNQSEFLYRFELTNTWHGPAPLNSSIHSDYEMAMVQYMFALCPAGNGVSTARFYEACFYGRVPILFADCMLLGEGYYDLDFVYRIWPYDSVDEIAKKLIEISETPEQEVIKRSKLARKYFDELVRPYIMNPTEEFLKWLINSKSKMSQTRT